MGALDRTVAQIIERIASRQHGVVARAQLLAAGVTRREIARRLQSGALLVEFRGVYRVGHRAPSTHSHYMAAVLACGEGALLSEKAAGHLLGILKGPAPPPEVTAPKQRRIEGITIKRSRRIYSLDATTWHGIPTTTVPRTLVDLAASLRLDDLARVCHEAGVRYQTTPAQVEQVLARRPSTPGAANLRAVLRGDAHVTLSKLERRFLSLLRRAGLPSPKPTAPPVGAGWTAAGPNIT